MARSNELVIGELMRRATKAGGAVSLRLSLAQEVNRKRGEPRYHLAVFLGNFAALGFILVDTRRGVPEVFTFAEVGKFVVKHLSHAPCAVTFTVPDASLMGVGFTKQRLTRQLEKFGAVDPALLDAEAGAKLATVSAWVESPRKAAVVAGAQAVKKSAALVRWMKGQAATAPAAEG